MSGLYDVQTQDALDALSRQQPAQPPATLGQVWDSNWQAAGLSTVAGLDAPRATAMAQLRGAYEAATGRSAIDDAQRQGIPLSQASPAEEVGTMRYLAQGLPDEARQKLDPYFDIDGQASRIAQAQERAAAETASNTWGLSAHGTAFLAGMARTMVDPVNLGAIAATGPVLGALGVAAPTTLAGHAAVDFATNAGITIVQHPFVSMGREQLGLQSPSLLEDATQAGLGGVALGGLFRAGGWALRRAFGQPATPAAAGATEGAPATAVDAENAMPAAWRAAAQPPSPDVRAAAGHLEPGDFNAAARFVENRELVESAGRGFGIDQWTLARNMDVAARQLEEGGQAAWHASPHEFTDFNLSAVGSGEGAQAFGHGLYFAENAGVALHYLRQFGAQDAHLYRVALDTAPERLVNWDAPIAEQAPPVRQAFEQLTGQRADDPAVARQFPTAGDWVGGRDAAGARDFAQSLRAQGVDGIQYYDAMSRKGEGGTRNFVMFDDNKVRVLNRNGQPIHPVAGDPRAQVEGNQPIAPEKAHSGVAMEGATDSAAPSGRASDAGARNSGAGDAGARNSGASEAAAPAGLDAPGQALRADAERALATWGDDLRLQATDEKGVTAETSGRALLSAADDLLAGVRELKDCIFGAAMGAAS